MKAIKLSEPTLYDQDFHAWTQLQARALAEGRVQELDWANLAEEIESLGISDRRALKSHLRVLIVHLLKWRHQFELRSNSWRNTITAQRDEIEDLLQSSPSLRQVVADTLDETYRRAIRTAEREATLFGGQFPIVCPFTLDQCLDPEFWPDDLDPPAAAR